MEYYSNIELGPYPKKTKILLKIQVNHTKTSSQKGRHTSRGPWNDRLGEGRTPDWGEVGLG
jgi:hypothetical protein